jgi:PAS domain S-box-containing protein
MRFTDRVRLLPVRYRRKLHWADWLAWAIMAATIVVVVAYEVWRQLVLDPARPAYLFWLETIVFGIAGPVVAWALVGQLARHAAAEELAARQIDALRAQESYLRNAVASSADGIIGLDQQDQILTWNRGAEAMFGYSAAEAVGQYPTMLLQPGEAGAAAWTEVKAQVSETGVLRNHEVLARTRDGRDFPVEVTHTLVRDDGGAILGSAAILRDITQRKTFEQEEQRRAQELATLYAVSTAMNHTLSADEALSTALDSVLDVLHLESGKIYLQDAATGQLTLAAARGNSELLHSEEREIAPGECLCGLALQDGNTLLATDTVADSRIIRTECLRHGRVACAAVPLLAKDRVLGVLHVAARSAAPFSSAGMALLRSIGVQVGTGLENMRLREEARRAEALSLLIQEMHHRIKNNLQTVADLLSLEMSNSENAEAQKSLRDSINRIKSIAVVHQLLSLEQLRLTNITELARQVCDISLSHLVHPDQPVEATITGPAIYLPSKQATALALVVNELVANAFEHAFERGQPGHVAIMVTQEGEQVSVSVTDNGKGLPEGFDPELSRGLGLQIVRTLVEKDLAGTLRLDSPPGGGCRATLTFYK